MSAASVDTQAPAALHGEPIPRHQVLATWRTLLTNALLILGLGLATLPARAADGCLVLLCFAAPSWHSIEQCVAAVESVLDDLAHGRPFPTCNTAGAGNDATLKWSDPPAFCPPQYTSAIDLESGTAYQCKYDGAVEVNVDDRLWTRTWWSESGDSVTEFTAAAKESLGSWDPRFDDDYVAWSAARTPACSDC